MQSCLTSAVRDCMILGQEGSVLPYTCICYWTIGHHAAVKSRTCPHLRVSPKPVVHKQDSSKQRLSSFVFFCLKKIGGVCAVDFKAECPCLVFTNLAKSVLS